jgi:hypothetical protein
VERFFSSPAILVVLLSNTRLQNDTWIDKAPSLSGLVWFLLLAFTSSSVAPPTDLADQHSCEAISPALWPVVSLPIKTILLLETKITTWSSALGG